ncbi:MAG: DUF3829 domain-containing protein [Bacteroidetes bacterium]|nr:MAG: DUF3829 domain-containing protein [Bacteroidota bacterium]
MKQNSFLKNLVFVTVVLAAVFAWYRYKGDPIPFVDQPEVQVGEMEVTPVQDPEAEEFTPTETAKKLNTFTQVLNYQSGRAFDSYERYTSWVDLKKGPTGKESSIYGLYELYDPQYYADETDEAIEEGPSLPELETAVDSYRVSLTQLSEIAQKANRYYDHEDYLDDAMAEGKSMHQPLLQAFSRYFAADKTLRELLLPLQTGQIRKETLEYSEGEYNPRWHGLNTTLKALDLIGSVRGYTTESVNRDTFALKLDGFRTALEAWERAYKAEGSADSWSQGCLTQYFEFLKSAKDMNRRMRDKVPFDESEKMWLRSPSTAHFVEGTPAKLYEQFQMVVSSYNSNPLNDRHVWLTEPTLPVPTVSPR